MDFDIVFRFFAAFICGYGLSLSGSLTQLSLRNPLASPSTLGFDAMGVLLSFSIFGLERYFIHKSFLSFFLIVIFSGFLFIFFRKFSLNFSLKSLQKILILGLSINLLLGALFSLYQFLAQTMMITIPNHLWFGNFRQVSSWQVFTFFIIVVTLKIFLKKQKSDLIALGIAPELAKNLGINASIVLKKSLFVSVTLTLFCINFFGIFSFLSLIFPHLWRIVGQKFNDPQFELNQGPIYAGLLLLMMDGACYYFLIWGAEIPVGLVASLIGSFVMVSMVAKQMKINL